MENYFLLVQENATKYVRGHNDSDKGEY